jgi:L-rhamnose mutarotase
MTRYGWVIGLKKEKVKEYKKLHSAVWPGVLKTIKKCNIQNYSIYCHQMPDGKYYLFAYLEYTGRNFEADMAKMAADPETQKWWAVCKPLQEPLPGCSKDKWWATMEEVFHIE